MTEVNETDALNTTANDNPTSSKTETTTTRNPCCTKFHKLWRPCLTKYHPLPNHNPSIFQRLCYSFRCPPHGIPGRVYCCLFVFIVLYGVVLVLAEDEALPGTCVQLNNSYQSENGSISAKLADVVLRITKKGYKCSGNFFGLYILFILSILAGYFVTFAKLPPLLGMLFVGCLLRNVPHFDFARSITKDWSQFLRSLALCIILLRAGLGLDPHVLRKLSAVVFRLAFVPCLVEALVTTLASHFILGLPWAWGIMLGFVLAAVSPAVIVPCMLTLKSQRLGTNKGIPTLVIAAASVDDVLAISGFQIFLSVAFSKSNLPLTLVKGPLEAILGVAYGIVFGILLWYIPPTKSGRFALYRFVLLSGLALFALLGSSVVHLPGAGALAVLSIALVASIGWRKRDNWVDDNNPLLSVFENLWWIIQPFLFGLIGAEVDFYLLNLQTVGKGIGCLAIGLAFRMVASFVVVLGTNLTMKERLFIPFAWMPKATVQAAIGSVAMDTAIKQDDTDGIVLGFQVLTIAVLSIIITAPIGAALIMLLAPRILTKSEEEVDGCGPTLELNNIPPDHDSNA